VKTQNKMKLFKILLVKDIKSEFRQIQDFFSILLFTFISVIIFSSAYNLNSGGLSMPLEIFIIQMWIILFFSLIFVRSYGPDALYSDTGFGSTFSLERVGQ